MSQPVSPEVLPVPPVEYHLTEAAIGLVSVLTELGAMGRAPATRHSGTGCAGVAARRRGPDLRERFMDERRDIHLRRRPAPEDGVLAESTAAYLRIAAGSGAQDRAGGR
ncbi:hypothetical protein ABZV91_00925 [Nocardia sp. NPDC004568]|uniref:hypothetical protein n=1 Tax=Nocardia sp. NPDC004568 TaxID=3154551 RepID=UPI0033A45765